jgi:hypothetical protein
MRNSSKKVLSFAALGFIASIAMTPLASAQPGPGTRGYGWGPGSMMGPGMMGPGMMGRGACDPGTAGLAAWRIERIERALKPTDAQKTALNDLKAASTKAAEAIAATCPREFPASATNRFDLMEKRLEAMLQAVKTVRPAFDAFYATLSAEQKTLVDSIGPRHWGWQRWRWREEK